MQPPYVLMTFHWTFAHDYRCIAYYFSGELASGGAAYIPTGRSLAIERQPFHVRLEKERTGPNPWH